MKKQDFVLLSAIILVGVLIVTLTVSFFKKYEMPQREHRNDRELNGISEEQTEMVLPPSELSIEEKIMRALSGLYIVDGDEMMCAGYRIKVGNPLITPRAGNWILDDCAKEDLIEEMDSEQNILSKETYICFGFNICCEEEFYPYITTGEQNELYLNNATLWLFNADGECLCSYEVHGMGQDIDVGSDNKSMYKRELSIGERIETELVFVDDRGYLQKDEPIYLVLEYNLAGGLGGGIDMKLLRKGVLFYVQN